MIEVVEHGEVRELRLARPPANALSPELLKELCSQVSAAPADGVGALVLSGSEGLFTGGLDVPLLLTFDHEEMVRTLDLFFGAMEALAVSEIPVAAAITGHSPAGGAVNKIRAGKSEWQEDVPKDVAQSIKRNKLWGCQD